MLENVMKPMGMKQIILIYTVLVLVVVSGMWYMNNSVNDLVRQNRSSSPVQALGSVLHAPGATFYDLSSDSVSDALQTASGLNMYQSATVELQ